ncbi:hypothetical protein [Kineococcus sp. SYSU DK003]|uniref:hypothetical protein n=1 Tax=Kineococcus sp. SYSU DK003 TaxID=3383124 RepID=UPI003D7EEA5B
MATSLAVCGASDDDTDEHHSVCVDKRTQQRTDGVHCDDDARAGGLQRIFFAASAVRLRGR